MMRRFLSGAAILILVVVSAWLGNRQFNREDTVTPMQPGEELGYAARDAELIETGADGRPLYTVDAELIHQWPSKGVVTLDTVRVDYRGEASNQWALSAEHGLIHESNNAIELAGNVHMVGILPGMTDLTQVFAPKLLFDPDTQIASTDQPVRLLSSGCELKASGLVANLNKRDVKLESNVHALCTPP